MNREQFKQQYSQDRAASRFVLEFERATGDYPEMLMIGISRSFDFCRMHGDRLGLFTRRHGIDPHKVRMHELRRRPRLPG